MQKIISIDYWLKKIWTAVWDTMMQIAFPKENFSSKKELFKFIEKNNYWIIILWNPKTNEDFYSDQEVICQNFFEELEEKYSDRKIIFTDERFSSKIAQRKMKDIWLNQKKWRTFEDNLAAQVLLEEFFETSKFDF